MKKDFSLFARILGIFSLINLFTLGLLSIEIYGFFNPYIPETFYENNFKAFLFGIPVLSVGYMSLEILFHNSKIKLFKKCRRYASVLFLLIFVVFITSCGDSKWSKSEQRVAEREKGVVVDSIEIPTQPDMSVRDFTIDSVQTEMPKENTNDKCGESQYPCHTFSVDLVILDSVLNEYKIFIRATKSNAPEDGADTEFNFKKEFYDELINGDLARLHARFVPEFQSGEGEGGNLYVSKFFPNSGKKIGNAHVIDEHSDEIFFGTAYMVPSKTNIAKLHVQ